VLVHQHLGLFEKFPEKLRQRKRGAVDVGVEVIHLAKNAEAVFVGKLALWYNVGLDRKYVLICQVERKT
jgi:hypothetical protein